MPVESLQTAQFRHGPLELAGPDLAAHGHRDRARDARPRPRDWPTSSSPRRRRAAIVTADGVRRAGCTSTIGPLDRLLAPAAVDRARPAARVAARDPRRARAGRVLPRREGDDP